MASSLWKVVKNQLIMKYCSKFLFSSICQNIFITYIKKNYHCKHSGLDLLVRNINNNKHSKVSIKFWQSINEGLFKVEYLTELSQYSGKSCKGNHEVTQQKFYE